MIYDGTKDVKKRHYAMRGALGEKKKKQILSQMFRQRLGYEMDWKEPRSVNQKVHWLKVYYQDPRITRCADKFAVKGYVEEKLGPGYVVPTIASWSDPDDIDFDALPDQFVLKVNWASGYNIIVKNKATLDRQKTREQLRRWIQPDRNSYYQWFNWGYKNMKPVIYAEEYIEQMDGQLYDYKFHFSRGKFLYMLIATDRNSERTLTYTFYDNQYNPLPLISGNKPKADPAPPMPDNLDKMLEMAAKLSADFPFVRVDFYEVGDKIYLGEMTFYPGGGTLPFEPREWDYRLGATFELPEKTIIEKETLGFRIKAGLINMKIAVSDALHAVRHALVHKHYRGKNKYLVLLGLRVPYETHNEFEGDVTRKFIRIFGVEFCYKRSAGRRSAAVNTGLAFRYQENTPVETFLMEPVITPELQRIHCEQKAYKQLGYFPDLRNPATLNEKIIWLAMHYKNPHIAVAADKGKAKEWISRRVGAQYVVPLLGVYDDVNDIDFAALPNRFVAKLNDGWGANEVMIVRDKNALNLDRAKAVMSSWLYPWNNYYYRNMCVTDEKMEKATVIIEEFLDAGNGAAPEDYKFYCCNGEPKFALVVAGRGGAQQTRSFVDMDWNVLPVARAGKPIAYDVEKPAVLDEMLQLCRTLAAGFPFVRVDLYEVNGRIYVGEMTFTPGMFLKFSDKQWDRKLGDYLQLPDLGPTP